MKKSGFIQKNAALVYFSTVFILSWGLILLLAGPGNMPIDPEQSEKLLPLLYTLMLVGPGLAGILMIWLVQGKEGFQQLKSRLLRWRAGIGWYALALFMAPALAVLILFILSRLDPGFSPITGQSPDKGAILATGMVTGLMVGLFEEIGWSGFVVPRLRQRYSILLSGIMVGLIWGAWHFILFWEGDSFSGGLPLLILLGRLFAWLPPFRVIMVWILDRTESLLLVILTHASLVFTTTVLVPMTLEGKALATWLLLWGAVLWIAVLVISQFKKGKLSHKPNDSI